MGVIGRIASAVYPGLDEQLWTRKRNAEMAAEIAAADYSTRLQGLPELAARESRRTHLVVVPQIGPDVDTWCAAGGNFFFEIAESAREYAGADRVSIFEVPRGEPAADWHARLIRHLVETGATHLIAQVEADPNSDHVLHSWDTMWSQLRERWDGVFLGVVTDSSFTWIEIGARRLARMSPNFVLVDICMPMDGRMVRGRPEVGPVNMPVSNASLAAVDARVAELPKLYDVSFIGTLYPYRVELLDRLRATGARVAVNPHRAEETRTFEESRANLPSYADYMTGLAQSHMTINFSQSSAGPFQQLKTRVLEASAMGCVVLTDDVDRTERFWAHDEYGYFAEPADLPGLVERLLADRDELESMQQRARARARALNDTSFWGGIDSTLRARGLPVVSKQPLLPVVTTR